MPVFDYTALNKQGKRINGVIDADSIRVARERLRRQGIFPTSVKEAVEKAQRSKDKAFSIFAKRALRIDVQTLAVSTRQLSTLIAAGIPIVETLRALSEQVDNKSLKQILSNVADKVNEGSTLADALQSYPQAFPQLYTNMVRSGESSGSLDIVLERLSDLFEAQAELRRQLMAASIYPALLIVLCIGVVVFFLNRIVPEMAAIFAEKKTLLPLPTRIVIGMSNFLQDYYLYLIFTVIVTIASVLSYYKTERGKKYIDGLSLRLPLIGGISIKVATSRIARTLGTMLSGGVEVLRALTIVKSISGNVVIEEALESATEGVREGRSLAGELRKRKLFPPLLIHMIAVGEKTGQLESLLLRAAKNFEQEVSALLTSLTKIIEPVLIIFIAFVVGGLLLSVMLPMLEMSSLAGQ